MIIIPLLSCTLTSCWCLLSSPLEGKGAHQHKPFKLPKAGWSARENGKYPTHFACLKMSLLYPHLYGSVAIERFNSSDLLFHVWPVVSFSFLKLIESSYHPQIYKHIFSMCLAVALTFIQKIVDTHKIFWILKLTSFSSGNVSSITSLVIYHIPFSYSFPEFPIFFCVPSSYFFPFFFLGDFLNFSFQSFYWVLFQ